MAERPVFKALASWPWYQMKPVTFVWNAGLSAAQKRKNIAAIHSAYCRKAPDERVLEISSKSTQGGEAFSAFYLDKFVPSLGKSVKLECIYQGGKHFSGGGPYTDLLEVTPRQAKKDPRLKESGRVLGFVFDGQEYPTEPRTAFYNWMYISALREMPAEKAEELLSYDAFTDIAFSPEGVNCQARAAAIFVGLSRAGRLDEVQTFEDYLRVVDRR